MSLSTEWRWRMLDSAGFRVLLFSHNEGIKAQSGEPGLKFTVDFGMGMLNALNLGDVTNEICTNSVHMRLFPEKPTVPSTRYGDSVYLSRASARRSKS